MNIEKIYELVKKRLEEIENNKIPIFVINRYAHLSENAVDILFGIYYKFHIEKELQNNMKLCKEKVRIVGPKNSLEANVIIGGDKNRSIVEISKSDADFLGIEAMLRDENDTKGTAGLLISNHENFIKFKEGIFVPNYSIFMSCEDALKYNIKNKDKVKVKIYSKRPLILEEVTVYVSEKYQTCLNIDEDTKNACFIDDKSYGEIYVQ